MLLSSMLSNRKAVETAWLFSLKAWTAGDIESLPVRNGSALLPARHAHSHRGEDGNEGAAGAHLLRLCGGGDHFGRLVTEQR